MESTAGISPEQLQVILQSLMKQQAEQTKEIVAAAITAAKAPTEAELKKAKEEQERYDKTIKQSMEQAKAEEMAKRARQQNCNHKKENGKWATGGQIIGGRYGLIVCQHCQKPWYAEFSQETISMINAGDLTLHQADPSTWMDEESWNEKQRATVA